MNPFLVKGYYSKELFCDREEEIKMLLRNVSNGIDTTLISPRRMGKTGLIMHFFEQLKETESNTDILYFDIFATRSLSDFVKCLAETILKKFPEKTNFGKKFISILKGLRPLIGYDTISGEPQIQISYHSNQEKEHTLQSLLQFLDSHKNQIVIAIDEFQQITQYPEENMEALLRTVIQQLKNIRFIFCGSKKSMMLNIFSNTKRPFFASTQYLNLDKIEKTKYAKFIVNIFTDHGFTINEDTVEFILTWTKRHTFYTQSICNMIYSFDEKNTNIDTVKEACYEVLKQNEPVFLQYRQMLTPAQWNFLIAIAKEDEVKQITSQKFIASYNIGTPANARRIAKSLEEKELILVSQEKHQTIYQVYDVFFSRWLQHEY
ncbi:MAG: hypothetical protein A2033_07580 [Bacteroidetes bacterium GWA2_31_9]|nr:MAG: hypothetical protein A2033_07580 [Bacteroidetes bacterium GWA2_31_9]